MQEVKIRYVTRAVGFIHESIVEYQVRYVRSSHVELRGCHNTSSGNAVGNSEARIAGEIFEIMHHSLLLIACEEFQQGQGIPALKVLTHVSIPTQVMHRTLSEALNTTLPRQYLPG